MADTAVLDPLKPAETATPEQPATPPAATKPKISWDEGKDSLWDVVSPGTKREDAIKQAEEAKKKKAEKTAEPPKTDDEKAAEKAATPPEPKPKSKLKAVEKKAEASTEDIISRTATATATAVAATLKKEEAKPEPAAPDILPSRARELKAVEYLAKSEPDKYSKKAEQFADFAKREKKYIDEWVSKNPDDEFDPDAKEHNAFYDKHSPDITDEEIEEAAIDMRADERATKRVAEKIKPLEDRLESLTTEQKVRDAAPVAEKLFAESVNTLLKALDPELVEIAAKGGPEKVKEKDPLADHIIRHVAQVVTYEVGEAVKLLSTDGKVYDEKNPTHKKLSADYTALETGLASADAEETTRDDGRKFATKAQWDALTPEQREKHWIIGPVELSRYVAAKHAEDAKKLYDAETERLDTLAKARGWTKNGEAAVNTEESEPQKPRSPSSATSTLLKSGDVIKPQTTRKPGDVVWANF